MLNPAFCTEIALALFVLAPIESAQWPQWGGRNRDFTADATNLAAAWPEDGPRKIWGRNMGAGYSSIAYADDRLYTMYREPRPEPVDDSLGPAPVEFPREEFVLALDAQSGKTIWEYRYDAPMPDEIDPSNIMGPNATPLLHDGRVYVFGVTGKLHCLDQKTGKPLWAHDVFAEYGAKVPGFGFASSPLIYKNSLILPVGGPGVGVIAFDLGTGEVQWKKHDFAGTHSSPLLIRLGDRDEMILLAGKEVVGMDPATGEIEWQYSFKSNIMTPVWGDDGILFVSSADLGSRGLKLSRKDGKVAVEELWTDKTLEVGFTNAVRSGNLIIACSGRDEYAMTAIDAATGKIAWQQPGFGMSNFVLADGKLIIVDNGALALGIPTPEGLQLKSRVPLLKKCVWSNPTIVGQRLFVRDHEMIMALDLGK